MSIEGLECVHAARGAHLVEWCGARVPGHYGDWRAEYRAVRENAGLIDLTWYGVLELTGPDRVVFLNGMVSNEVRNLGATGGCHASLLTVHGKVVADVVALGLEERILLLVARGLTGTVAENLNKYLVADEVEIADRSAELGLLGASGPNAGDLLAGQGWPVPSALWHHAAVPELPLRLVRMNLTGEPSWGILGERSLLPEIWETIIVAGALPVGVEALNVLRIEAGIPWHGVDATEDDFPLETRLEDTISTTKGCYLGQETIIRIFRRGHVNRRMVGLVLEGRNVPPHGCEVLKDGQAVGKVTSAAWSPARERVIALAVVRVRAAESGATLQVALPDGLMNAVVTDLPFVGKPAS